MKLTYTLRVVCVAKTEDGVPFATKYVEVKNETYESLAAAAREARRWCEEQSFNHPSAEASAKPLNHHPSTIN